VDEQEQAPANADDQSCIFCPNEGGAFKQTTTGHWSHLLCAVWIPELSIGNAIYQEPVQDVEHLPKSRWKLVSDALQFPRVMLINSFAHYAVKDVVLVYSATTRHATRPFTSLVPGKRVN
jgi:hypothetical protein